MTEDEVKRHKYRITMSILPPAQLIYGLHPGLLVARELTKRGISKAAFSSHIQEDLNLMEDLLEGKIPVTEPIAHKIESDFGWPDGLLLELQARVQPATQAETAPFLLKIRKALFWDTDIRLIDPVKHRKAIIIRVFTKGTAEEKELVTEHYGNEAIRQALLGAY